MSKKTQRAKLPGAPDEKGAADELYFEAVVANRLGVSRERVRELRVAHLREGEDWVMQGTSVVLSAQGLAMMQKLVLEGSCPAITESGPVAATGGAYGVAGYGCMPLAAEARVPVGQVFAAVARVRVRVTERARNVRVIMAARVEGVPAPGEPARLMVLVQSNELFMPGMEMEVAPVEGRGCFQYLGRLPRRKGVW